MNYDPALAHSVERELSVLLESRKQLALLEERQEEEIQEALDSNLSIQELDELLIKHQKETDQLVSKLLKGQCRYEFSIKPTSSSS